MVPIWLVSYYMADGFCFTLPLKVPNTKESFFYQLMDRGIGNKTLVT